MSDRELGVGIIGFGFMGRTHFEAYAKTKRGKVVAIADQFPDRVRESGSGGNLGTGTTPFDLDDVRIYATPEELLADPRVDAVSVCTPTDTHVDLGIAALRSNKHVLVEKPVALKSSEVQRLVEAERASDARAMAALCMRFWPGWSWLQETVDKGTYGKVRSAVFRRLGSHPGWNDFYRDPERCGGALFDLHIHDTDFVQHLFGMPEAVTSHGTLDHVTTFYHYDDGPPHVVAEGGWNHTPGFEFFMGYTCVFEQATADFALGRAPVLRLSRDGEHEPIELAGDTGYEAEVDHFLALCSGASDPRASLEAAVRTTRVLEAEARSLARNAREQLAGS